MDNLENLVFGTCFHDKLLEQVVYMLSLDKTEESPETIKYTSPNILPTMEHHNDNDPFSEIKDSDKTTKYEQFLQWHLEKRGVKIIPQYKLQHPWGVNSWDLAIPEWKVLIEVDGSHHKSDPEQKRKDKVRMRSAHMCGWRVRHFTNKQVYENMVVVMEQIMRYRPGGPRGLDTLAGDE